MKITRGLIQHRRWPTATCNVILTYSPVGRLNEEKLYMSNVLSSSRPIFLAVYSWSKHSLVHQGWWSDEGSISSSRISLLLRCLGTSLHARKRLINHSGRWRCRINGNLSSSHSPLRSVRLQASSLSYTFRTFQTMRWNAVIVRTFRRRWKLERETARTWQRTCKKKLESEFGN